MKYQFTCSGTLTEITALIAAVQAAGVLPATPETTAQVNSHETPEPISDYGVDEDGNLVENAAEQAVLARIQKERADFMYNALTRHRLTEHTRNMLEVLYKAEDYVQYSTLCDELGLEPNRLRGVLARFSKRVRDTEGYDKMPYFKRKMPYFKRKRHAQTNEWCYRLTDELREVVRVILGDD